MGIRNYGLISSIDELAALIDRISGNVIAIDIETGFHGPDREKAAVHPETAFVVGISFTDSVDWARYVPLGHDEGENLDNAEVARLFWPLLNQGLAVAHNMGFELRHLSRWFLAHLADDPDYGEQVRASNGYFPIRSDTMVEAYLAADFQRFGLKPLTMLLFDRTGALVHPDLYVNRMLQVAEINKIKEPAERKQALSEFDGHVMTELHELFPDLPKNRHKFLRFNTLGLTPQVIEYACEDSVWCLAIHQHYYPRVKDRPLFPVEIAIVQDVLPPMEDEGIQYAWGLMSRTADELRLFRDRFNAEIMQELTVLTGELTAISLASAPQISSVLYDKLGYSTDVYTDKTRDLPPGERRMSTGKIALERLAKQYPVVQKIRQWKQMTRLLGTYLDRYEGLYNYAADGRAHPNHLSAFVITGRFAHTSPPYAQSPKKYHYDLAEAKAAHAAGEQPPPGTCFIFNFRDMIVAPPEHYILGFDLSQAELRAVAGLAQETALLEAFANGEDVHRLTASLMLGIPLADVDAKQRDIGKAQPLDAKILTPTGWRLLGDLQVGDQVIGGNGEACKVTGVFPQGDREVFRVTTADGACVESCAEHLWTVRNRNTKDGKWVTKELRKLMAKGIRNKTGQPKYILPDRPVVQFEPGPDLPIDPYVLGALLGDGGFTNHWGPMFGSMDQELLDSVRVEHERLGGRWASEKEASPGFRVAYLACGVKFKRGTNVIKDSLCDLGLWGQLGRDKFVPDVYLHAAPEDRLAMLQGLLDTDGNVQASGAMFRVTSRALAEAVQFLARSLGGWSSIHSMGIKKTSLHVKSEGSEVWCVYIRLPAGMCPFRLTRKVKAWKETVYRAPQTIFAVEPVGIKPTQCISVDDQNGHYITDGFTVVHNTLNFALLFGLSPKGLSDRLAIPFDEARSLMDKYFAGLPAVAAFMAEMVQFGRTHGYVVSAFGRKLPIWEYLSDKRSIRSKGDRACVNYPVQGGATGDYMKTAMVRATAALKQAGLADRVKMVMNIHDALEFYVHRSVDPQEVIAVLKPAVLFPVPGWPAMQADWHIARKWGSPLAVTVNDDGSLTITGDKVYELAPTLEEDEDGEFVEVLPDVDIEILRQAAQLDSGRFRVVLTGMPVPQNWRMFIASVKAAPGSNGVQVRTPDGDIDLPFTTMLCPDDAPELAVLLGDPGLTAGWVDAAATASVQPGR